MLIALNHIFALPFHYYPECGFWCPFAGMFAATIIVISWFFISKRIKIFSLFGFNIFFFILYIFLFSWIFSIAFGILLFSFIEPMSISDWIHEFNRWGLYIIEFAIELGSIAMIYMLPWLMVESVLVILGFILITLFKKKRAI